MCQVISVRELRCYEHNYPYQFGMKYVKSHSRINMIREMIDQLNDDNVNLDRLEEGSEVIAVVKHFDKLMYILNRYRVVSLILVDMHLRTTIEDISLESSKYIEEFGVINCIIERQCELILPNLSRFISMNNIFIDISYDVEGGISNVTDRQRDGCVLESFGEILSVGFKIITNDVSNITHLRMCENNLEPMDISSLNNLKELIINYKDITSVQDIPDDIEYLDLIGSSNEPISSDIKKLVVTMDRFRDIHTLIMPSYDESYVLNRLINNDSLIHLSIRAINTSGTFNSKVSYSPYLEKLRIFELNVYDQEVEDQFIVNATNLSHLSIGDSKYHKLNVDTPQSVSLIE